MNAPAVVQKPPTPSPALPSGLSTPAWLTGSIALSWALIASFVLISTSAVRNQRAVIKAIADDSARSVIAAQKIGTALADMDANALSGLMGLQQQQRDDSAKAFHQARARLASALVEASKNITYDREEDLLRTLTDTSSEYDSAIRAAYALQSANANGVTAQYNKAAAILDQQLQPKVQDLAALNRGELDQNFERLKALDTRMKWLVGIAGAILIVLLLRIQVFVSDRMRRTLSPLLLLSTLFVVGLLFYSEHALVTATDQTYKLKSAAFESLHSIWRAKTAAFEAHTEQSRSLFDPANAGSYSAAFQKLSDEISNNPRQLLAWSPAPPAVAKGFLADELRNLNYAGESEAATHAVTWWNKYLETNAEIRRLEAQGKHQQAVALCVGTGQDQSGWVLEKLNQELTAVLDIDQREFETARSRGFQVLGNFEWASPIVGLITALCVLFGVLPRIREYSA